MCCTSILLFVVIAFVLLLGQEESPWELRSVVLMTISSGIRVSHLIVFVWLHGNLGRLSVYMDYSKDGTYNRGFVLLDEKIKKYQKKKMCKKNTKQSNVEHRTHKKENETTKHSDKEINLFEDPKFLDEEQVINDGVEQYVLGY